MDFSFLSQGQPVQLPNPLQNALQAMTLGQLASRNALINVETQKTQRALDDQTAAAQVYADAQTMGWDAARQKAIQDGNIRGAQLSLQAQRADETLQTQTALQRAQALEAQGKASQAQAAALKDNLVSVGNFAGTLADQAAKGQIDPWRALSQVSFAAQKAGLDPRQFGVVDTSVPGGDPTQALTQLQSVAGNALSAADRIKLPSEVSLNTAKANEANTTAQYIPMNAQSTRISANAAASNAATAAARQQYGEATVVPNPITGESSRVLPGNAQNPAGVALPVSNAQGQPAQTGAPAMTSEVMKANAPRFAKAADDLTTYNKVLQSLPLLKATLQSGYTGPLIGSDEGKQALAILSTIPGIGNVVDMDKLANSKAADAIQGELIGDLIKEISTRGSNMATKVVLARKPGTENPLQANLAMIDALEVDSKNGINNAQALLNYAQQNPRDITLSGFKAPTPKLPPNLGGGGQTFDSMPDPSTLPGRRVAAPDGTIYQSTPAPGGGFQWMRQ